LVHFIFIANCKLRNQLKLEIIVRRTIIFTTMVGHLNYIHIDGEIKKCPNISSIFKHDVTNSF